MKNIKKEKIIKAWAVIGMNGKPYTCNCHNGDSSMYWIFKSKKEAKYLKDIQRGEKLLPCEIKIKL